MKSVVKKLWDYIEGINGLILILYSIFIFSTFAFVVENDLKYFLRWFFLIIIVSIMCCPIVLRSTKKLEFNYQLASNKNDIKWRFLFFVIPFLLFFLKYLIYFPTAFSVDSINQYTQALNNQYNDWHPVIQTLISFKLPLLLTGGWVGSISLFQIIAFSIVLAYSLLSIKKYANIKYAVFALLFIMLNPQTTNIALYPWKDVSFAIGALLLLTYVLHIYFTNGDWIKKPINIILFIIVASLTTLLRHNALLFTIPLLIAVFFLIAKKRALIVYICVAILVFGIKVPLYSALNVEAPNKRQVETLGLPMTVIGAVVTYAPEQLDEETREFAYKVAPKEAWEEKYQYGNYNLVKYDSRTNNKVIEEYGTEKVLNMTFNCIKRSPIISFKALIKLTDVVYTVCDNYRYYVLPRIEQNSYGISTQGVPLLQNINEITSKTIWIFLPRLFMYIGSMHLILVVSVLSKCKLNRWKDWKRLLIILSVFAYNFGTALLLTGAGDSSRFFYYTFLITPTLLVFLFREKDERIKTTI